MTQTIISVCCLAFAVFISILSFKERRELMTRVMCRSAREYEEIVHPKEEKRPEKSAHQKAIDAFHRKGLDV